MKMDTLREHLQEMLYAVAEQVKIPNTKLLGDVWLEIRGSVCTMCAAGAWYAQKYGRCPPLIDIDSTILDAMWIMDYLRKGDVQAAHMGVYGRALELNVPVDMFGVDNMDTDAEWRSSTDMDDEWRSSMDKLLLWLTENNL